MKGKEVKMRKSALFICKAKVKAAHFGVKKIFVQVIRTVFLNHFDQRVRKCMFMKPVAVKTDVNY